MKGRHSALVILMVLRLALGLAYTALVPLGEAPDEADHYAYAAHIGQTGSLPAGPALTQGKHPPLYYGLAAAVAGWTGMDTTFLRSNPDASLAPGSQSPNLFLHTRLESWPWRDGALAMHLGRLISVLAGLVLVAVTYALGRSLWPVDPALAMAGAALAAFLPESLFVGGAMSNDMLAATFAALAMLAAQRGRGWRGSLATGFCLGLGILTKASVIALAPVLLAVVALRQAEVASASRSVEGARRWFSRLWRPLLVGVVALGVAAPWLWRNWQLYGDPIGATLVLATIDRRSGPMAAADLWWLASGWFFSFWGKFGGAGQLALPWPLYAGWGVILIGGLSGWLYAGRQALRGRGRLAQGILPSTMVLLWASPVLVAFSMLGYSSLALGTDQGRLLFPALVPSALLLAAGVWAWLPEQVRQRALFAWSGLLLCAAVLALVSGVVKTYAPPSEAPPDLAAQATLVQRYFGPDLELVALRWSAPAQGRLTLYWRVTNPVSGDLRTAVRLYSQDGSLIWEWKRSPGAGRLSTDWWQTGRMVADGYEIPPALLARAQRAEVGVYAFDGGAWLQPAGSAPANPFVALPGLQIDATTSSLAPAHACVAGQSFLTPWRAKCAPPAQKETT